MPGCAGRESLMTEEVKFLRQAAELTQVELARGLGVTQAAISRIEQPHDLLLSTLNSYLGVWRARTQDPSDSPGAPAWSRPGPILLRVCAAQRPHRLFAAKVKSGPRMARRTQPMVCVTACPAAHPP
jgi:hypothetical protein